jgi:hypothetical protein
MAGRFNHGLVEGEANGKETCQSGDSPWLRNDSAFRCDPPRRIARKAIIQILGGTACLDIRLGVSGFQGALGFAPTPDT